ncbi:hypothetical protein QZN11_27560 [Streptomyces gramineus]|uniref:DUF3592 domain-containing protein n=1 Tax=Streptomyces gramineus TaxID=910542 RepID=UPI00398AD98F
MLLETDGDQPRHTGTGLMTEGPLERAAPNRLRLLPRGLAGGYALVLVLLLVKGAGLAPVLPWALAPDPIGRGGSGVHSGWEAARDTRVLRTRGITVEGRLHRPHQNDGVDRYTYTYIDNEGIRRDHTSSDGGGERVEITYDPAHPETTEIGRRAAGWLVFGAASILLAGVAFVVVGVLGLVI